MEKFKKPRLLTPRGQSHKKFWQAVGLCALTAALFFLPFYILDGGFFHYAGDFNSQQISFYRYMNGFVKGLGYPDSPLAGALQANALDLERAAASALQALQALGYQGMSMDFAVRGVCVDCATGTAPSPSLSAP